MAKPENDGTSGKKNAKATEAVTTVSDSEEKLSDAELVRLNSFKKRYEERKLARFKSEVKDGHSITFKGSVVMGAMCLSEASGTIDNALAGEIVGQVASTFRREETVDAYNLALAAMYDFRPNNLLEGQLCSQLIASHNLSMTLMARASHGTNQEHVVANAGLSERLMNLYIKQVEALGRLRGGESRGRQEIIVKHMSVGSLNSGVVNNSIVPNAPQAIDMARAGEFVAISGVKESAAVEGHRG